MTWHAIIRDASGQLEIINIFQFCDFNIKWRSTDPLDWPKEQILYKDADFSIKYGTVEFIGGEEEARQKMEEMLTFVDVNSLTVAKLNEKISIMEREQTKMLNRIQELERKITDLERRIQYMNFPLVLDVITVGRNRINLHVSDLATALVPEDDVKGFTTLARIIFPEKMSAGQIWSNFSHDTRDNFLDLIKSFLEYKYKDKDANEQKLAIKILKKRFIKKLQNDRDRIKKNQS
ncbi:hypothetical protein HUG17_10655 [Dermatophagoides farinae]|uniref:Uncharacterized protein n=1 Tax=Dermatophagoides farinae TaxID=6954 RepID=A0A9D4NZ57_DERFA|nr:hypothetical protein HUG17_10655 [Dermatophagoides farinae]